MSFITRLGRALLLAALTLVLVGGTVVLAQNSVAANAAEDYDKATNIQKEMKSALRGIMANADQNLDDGERYKGNLYDGDRHGWGIYYWSDGAYYFGGWSNGEASGYGMDLMPDGRDVTNCSNCAVYVGNYDNGDKSGTGKCYDKYGNMIYYGNFSNNKPTGTYPANGNYPYNKFQVLDMGDGAKYVGETKDGKRHGWGAYVWKSKDVWYGSWKDGARGGKGMYTQYNGAWTLNNCNGDNCQKISSSSDYQVSSSSNNNYSSGGSYNNGCNDGGYVMCPACFGAKRKGTCSVCGGTGRRAGNKFCGSCMGTGVGLCGICLGVGSVSKSDPRFCNENIYDGRYKNSGDILNPAGNPVYSSGGGGGGGNGGGGGGSSSECASLQAQYGIWKNRQRNESNRAISRTYHNDGTAGGHRNANQSKHYAREASNEMNHILQKAARIGCSVH
jgi:hypothetical protein